MAKIFISTLGTNVYVPCNYYFDNKNDDDHKIKKVRFVQETIIRYFCKDWSAENGDRIHILCTDKSEIKNWQDNGQHCKDYKGLSTQLKKIFDEEPYKHVSYNDNILKTISEGYCENEIWNNFDTITNLIHDGDKIYFDITHSFRSLPMLSLIILQYVRVVRKNCFIEAITYGAFEKLGPALEVEQMPIEERNAPVLDLSPLVRLMDWTSAAKEFIDYGKTDSLKKMINLENEPILKATEGSDKTAQILKKSIKGIEEFAASIFTNKLQEIYEFKTKSSIETLKNENKNDIKIKPFVPLIKKITDKVSPFDRNDWNNVFAATQWCIDHEMYQNAYSILLEGIISITLEKVGVPTDEKSCFRDLPINVARVMVQSEQNPIENINNLNDHDPNSKQKEIYERIFKIYTKDVAQKIYNLVSYRNSYMHAGTKEPLPKDITTKINEYNESLKTWWESLTIQK
jgi:CRISPR-associated Csx2 family protein